MRVCLDCRVSICVTSVMWAMSDMSVTAAASIVTIVRRGRPRDHTSDKRLRWGNKPLLTGQSKCKRTSRSHPMSTVRGVRWQAKNRSKKRMQFPNRKLAEIRREMLNTQFKIRASSRSNIWGMLRAAKMFIIQQLGGSYSISVHLLRFFSWATSFTVAFQIHSRMFGRTNELCSSWREACRTLRNFRPSASFFIWSYFIHYIVSETFQNAIPT